MGTLTFGWFGGQSRRRRRTAPVPVPLMPSRDLPPVDFETQPSLPRSPEAIPDEALVFAQSAARRAPEDDLDDNAAFMPAASIATGADLRAMLERFERAHRRRQVREQAVQARSRLVERLSAGRAATAGPTLRLVGADDAVLQADEEKRIDQAMEEALASALTTLKRLSARTRD
ncbi:MAG: hypothetical protein J7494_00830 [Sphingobium sp.]|nr:hypothetical protein [Sphingobium sp.]